MKNLNRRRWTLTCVALAASCQTSTLDVPTIDEALEAPAAWSQSTGAERVSDTWWMDFGDPVMNALIEEALATSPDLAAAGSRVAAASANLSAMSGMDDPQLSAGLNLSRRRQNFIGLPIPGASVASSTSNNHGLSLNASWEIDLWGRLAAGERAAAANLSASLADLDAAQLALSTAVARSYFALVEARGSLQLAQQYIVNTTSSLEQAELLEQSGRGSISAVLTARAALQRARANTTQARQRAEALEPNLAALIGRNGGNIDVTLPLMAGQPLVAPPSAGLPAELLARRADLAALEARVQMAHAQAEMAHGALFPKISLSASVGTAADDLTDLLNGDFRVWSLGANILAPLLNGGRLRAEERAALANRDAALFAFASRALLAFAEVETALINGTRIEERRAEIELLLKQLEALEDTALRHHQRGVGNAADVYSARNNQLDAHTSLLALQTLACNNRVNLIHALGGGFERNPSGDTQPQDESTRENSL